MFITIAEKDYELSTKMAVGRKLEDKFKQPLPKLFERLGEALTEELITILTVAADKTGDAEFKDAVYDNWDYTDLYSAVQELIVRLMYSGTPEQIEAKFEKSGMPENRKNAIRELLGMPKPSAPFIGNE